MTKNRLLALIALVVTVTAVLSAAGAYANDDGPEANQVGYWCTDGGVKYEPVDTPFIVPEPPEGKVWTLLVIKAGSGEGSNETYPNPVVGQGYSHSSGKDNSHVILCMEEEQPSTTTTTSEPPLSTTTSSTTTSTVPTTSSTSTTSTSSTTTTTVPVTTTSSSTTTTVPVTTSTSIPSTTSTTSTTVTTTTVPQTTTTTEPPTTTTDPSTTTTTTASTTTTEPPASTTTTQPCDEGQERNAAGECILPVTGVDSTTFGLIGLGMFALGLLAVRFSSRHLDSAAS